MRLLFVHERFGALAGAEANAYLTATALAERGHEIGLIHGPGTGKDEPAWRQTFSFRRQIGPGTKQAEVESAVAAFNPDAIYVHKMSDLPVLAALVLSRRRLVRMVHDHDIYCMRSYRYSYFTRRICTRPFGRHCLFPCAAFVVRRNDGKFPVRFVSYKAKRQELELNRKFHRMIVVTRYMRDQLLVNGFDPARIVIYPPIPKMGDPTLQSSFSNRNLIVFAGQIIRGKGVDVLLQSLAQLQVPFECVILGDGNHRSHCERLRQKLKLTERVRFEGFVPQPKLKEYYRECSVVAISSVWPEPIATIGLEVMRYGLHVVAFNAGGIQDWLIDGFNGFLVPWMDRAAYAAKLELLLNNKALARQMGEHGRQLAREKYDFSQYISQLEQLFHDVVAESRSDGLTV